MRWLSVLLLCLPLYAAKASSATYVMDLPVLIDSTEVGTLTAGIENMELVHIRADSLIRLANKELSDAMAKRVTEAVEGGDTIAVEKARSAGLDIRFEPARLQLVITPSEDQRRRRELSSGPRATGGTAEPSRGVSSFLNYNLSQSYVHRSQVSPTGREPLAGFLDGGVNLGFLGPVALEWEALYREEDDTPWARGDSRLVVDDQSRAVRYALGDINYQSTEFQGAPELLGVSAERRYGTLQPYNIISATGQQSFSIRNTSRVDVYVNGILQTTQRLLPGQYDLSDFSFAEGLNDIELVITDDFGRVERVSFSLFLDSTLLKEGISEFSFNAGYRREDDIAGKEIEYDYDRPAFSGFYRHGITSNLTLGGQYQGEPGLDLYGAEAVVGTPLGTFATTVSRSESEAFGEAMAASARWRYEVPVEGLNRPLTLQAASVFSERNYLSMGQISPITTFRTQHQLRVASEIPGDIFLGLTLRQADAFSDRGEDETGVGVSASRRFGWFSLNLFADHVESDESETSVLASVSVPLGAGRQIRANYDRLQKTTSVQYSDFPVNVANDWSGSVEIERDELDEVEHRVSGDLNYTANRYIARVAHEYSQAGFFEGETEERSRADFSGALVFAEGTFALSRPVFDSFVLVERHDSLSDTDILVNETSEGPTAIADVFGPAVLPGLSSYREQQVYWRAETLAPGYDMGDTDHRLTPSYKSGFAFTAGSDSSVIAIGTVISSTAEDLGLKGGVIEPVDERDFPARQTFTNRKGRFVAQQLEPGDYRLTLGNALVGFFSISPDAIGYVDLGEIRLEVEP